MWVFRRILRRWRYFSLLKYNFFKSECEKSCLTCDNQNKWTYFSWSQRGSRGKRRRVREHKWLPWRREARSPSSANKSRRSIWNQFQPETQAAVHEKDNSVNIKKNIPNNIYKYEAARLSLAALPRRYCRVLLSVSLRDEAHSVLSVRSKGRREEEIRGAIKVRKQKGTGRRTCKQACRVGLSSVAFTTAVVQRTRSRMHRVTVVVNPLSRQGIHGRTESD